MPAHVISKILPLALLLLLLPGRRAGAQEVVIDPSQIAASAINVADQIDYAIDQLGELLDMGDKLGGLKEHIDNVFGEEGAGGRAVALMQDLGTLERLTRTYNQTLQSAVRYAEGMKELSSFRMADVNGMLAYLNSSKQTAELAVTTARKILSSLGFSKGEKKAELDRIIAELEETLAEMEDSLDLEMEATLVAEGLDGFMDILDDDLSVENYVDSRREYGEAKGSAGRALGLVTVLLMMLGAVSVAYGYVVYLRGGISGDPTAQNIFIRVGAALFAGMFVINVLSRLFHLTL